MADKKEIVVTLKVEETEGGKDKEPGVDVGSPETTKGDSVAKSAFKTIGIHVASAVISEGVNWAEYFWNRELMLNDDYVGQREKRIAMQCINKTISYATSMASGAAMGSVLGPVGAVVGAAVGLTFSALGTVRENAQAMDQQNIMINQMNAQLDYTRQRAGWSLEAASIGEDL